MKKSTLPKEILDKIADEMESLFKEWGMFYIREDTVFHLHQHEAHRLFDAQLKANQILLKSGVLTQKMLLDDFNSMLTNCG